MNDEICNRIIAKYAELEKAGYCHNLSIQLSLVLGVLIFLCVLIWSLDVPDYVKYIGSVATILVIILLSFHLGKFFFF